MSTATYIGISFEGMATLADDLEKIIKPEVWTWQEENFVTFAIERAKIVNEETYERGLSKPDQCRIKIDKNWTISGEDEELTVTGLLFTMEEEIK